MNSQGGMMPTYFPQNVAESFLNLSNIFNDIGSIEPYYSVLSHPKYMKRNLTPENLNEFFDSGRRSVNFIFTVLENCGVDIELEDALDFGCGVGRVTIPLASRFTKVIGCDISDGNLAAAIKEAKRHGTSNIGLIKNEFNLLQQFGAGRFSFIYSCLVLQHMIPPLMKLYISQFFQMLKPGGIAFFQLPTSGPDYHFGQQVLQKSIDSDRVQLHALSFNEIFMIINAQACRIIDIHEIDCVGPGWKSFFFVVEKPKVLPSEKS